jgi:PAS domain S-box-containing protein
MPTNSGRPRESAIVMAPPTPPQMRRRATVVIAVLAPAAGLAIGAVGLVCREPRLFVWTAMGMGMGVTAGAALAVRRGDPAGILLLAAAATGLASHVAPESSVPGVVAALATMSIVLLAVIEPGRKGAVLAVLIFGCLGVAFLPERVDAGRVAGFVGLLAAGAGSWVVLGNLVTQAKAGETGYRHLFDRVPVGLYRTGLRGEILEINPAFAEILGSSRRDLIGRLVSDFLVDPDDLARLREVVGAGSDPVTTDLRFRSADGAIVWLRDVTRPVLDETGTIVCFEGEIQDVTARRRQLEQLEALVRSKSELITAVSHELRTPLTAVVGFLDVLREQPDLSDGGHDLLAMACEQAHDVAGIVEDLLTSARLDNRELHVRSELVDVAAAVAGALNSLGVDDRPGVLVAVPDEAYVVADAARVRQVVRNLLVNACRHGMAPIAIRTSPGVGTVEVVVSDHGAPISAEVMSRMWDAFYTGTEGTGAVPGSIGLGLAVSSRLVVLMGGTLSYRRVAARNEFVLSLPAAAPQRKSA